MSVLGSLFGGDVSQIPTVTPQQQQLQNLALQQFQSLLPQLTQMGSFAPIAQRARQQFQQQTVPSLAERFTALGEGRLSTDPGFQRALGQAGADLESQLAAQEAQFGMQERGQLGSLLQFLGLIGAMPTTQTQMNRGFFPGLLQQAASGIGELGRQYVKQRFLTPSMQSSSGELPSLPQQSGFAKAGLGALQGAGAGTAFGLPGQVAGGLLGGLQGYLS